MAAIQVLDQSTINKIAAGEVVERPSSVVKELLENAIDAGASAVTVEIKDGGCTMIRITDNGCGIPADEVSTAFLRHSTSKIRSIEDLMTVSSLGFRGEALSSIAAVAQVELLTKTKDAMFGVRYRIEGGKELGMEEIGIPDGTTFIVRNLFYNTPARKKFLKSSMTEASYVSDLVEQISLSHPEVSIRLIQNGQSRLHTSGNTNIKDIIYNLYGKDIAQSLLAVEGSSETIKISGFIGKPVIARGNRNAEHYFINGRYIRSSLIAKAIEEAFRPFMMQHKYPFCVLMIETEAELLDVNVHPTKLELRFRNQEEMYQCILKSLTEALGRPVLIPEAELPEPVQAGKEDMTFSLPETEPSKEQTDAGPTSLRGAEPFEARRNEETMPVYEDRLREESPAPSRQLSMFDRESMQAEEKPQYRIVGQVFDTYWMVEQEEHLYIIDQHAAHEKVLFERTMKRYRKHIVYSQQLFPPVILQLSQREAVMLAQYRSYFESLGFELESFGGNDYAVRAVPDNVFSVNTTDLFVSCLDSLSEYNAQTDPELILERVASVSCKAAVKGNTKLSFEEADHLIGELLTLDQPFHCPHGRPTMIEMTKYEMEKKFKRIV